MHQCHGKDRCRGDLGGKVPCLSSSMDDTLQNTGILVVITTTKVMLDDQTALIRRVAKIRVRRN